MAASRWDETWHRLLEWTNGQAPSERMAVQMLYAEGYRRIDPSHPLGGKDGGKDALCEFDNALWIMAAYFPRGQKDFEEIKKKFLNDLEGAKSCGVSGIAFVTNQELRLAERENLVDAALPLRANIFHLERITGILDRPEMAAVRKQFLGIDSEESQQIKLGGEGGKGIAAGGGGGGAFGPGATGGPGGAATLDWRANQPKHLVLVVEG
jgi:hypothetical protein